MKAASAANIRLVLPAAAIRSALFLPGAVVFVRELVGFRVPVSVAVVAAGVGVGVGFADVLCRTSKHMSWNVMIGAKGMEQKYARNRINGARRGNCRGGLSDSKLPRLSENGVCVLRVLDKVDLEASPDREPSAR
jgi:hypothetical protein